MPKDPLDKRKERDMEFHTGDQPGEGRYRCKNCGYIVRITSDTEKLPACPNCGHHEFEKLEDED
nr:hypothetical protein [Gordonibacter urolithinfaciens]